MSYEKLKKIKVNGQTVTFERKCNNDTEPYRADSCTIPEFLHNALGNVFQFNNDKLNAIVKEFRDKLKDSSAFWWTFENWGIDSEKICPEEKQLFANYCDKIKGVGAY